MDAPTPALAVGTPTPEKHHISERGLLLFDIVNIVVSLFVGGEIGKKINSAVRNWRSGRKPQAGTVTTADAQSVAVATQQSAPAEHVEGAPFGLERFSSQDEVRMKLLWDMTVRSFREMRQATTITNPTDLCHNFAKLCAGQLNTYDKQERLRTYITRNQDDRQAVEGCRTMVLECSSPERFTAYMTQIAVLPMPTTFDIAREKAADVYRTRDQQIKANEARRRRAFATRAGGSGGGGWSWNHWPWS